MDKQIIEEKVKAIIRENGQFNNEEVDINADLRDSYGIDSLIIVNILVEIESMFNITIDSALLTYESFSTADKIINYIYNSLKE